MMGSIWIYFIAIFYLFWVVLSVLNQFRFKWFMPLKLYDYFAMIPSWSFFAPNPGRTDYHLLYRTEQKDGTISPWNELKCESNKMLQGVWNPNKRKQKAIIDNVSELKLLMYSFTSESLVLSNAYLTLLSIVAKDEEVLTKPNHKLQFSILETYGHYNLYKPNTVLISKWHKL